MHTYPKFVLCTPTYYVCTFVDPVNLRDLFNASHVSFIYSGYYQPGAQQVGIPFLHPFVVSLLEINASLDLVVRVT